MATKKSDEEQPGTIDETAAEPQAAEPAAGSLVVMYVRIVNLEKATRQYHLLDGTTVACGPFLPGKDINKSDPVLKKLISPQIRVLEKRGQLAFEPVTGGI